MVKHRHAAVEVGDAAILFDKGQEWRNRGDARGAGLLFPVAIRL